MLTQTEVQQIIKGEIRGERESKQRAIEQQNRIRLHSEISINQRCTSAAITPFLNFVDSLLPSEKYYTFCQLLRYPVSTVSLTESIYTALQKIFDGRNPVFKYEFLSDSDAEDWDEYRNNELSSLMCWKTKGFERMKTAINSIVIIDLPEFQDSEKPKPYFEFLDIEKVIDWKCEGDEFQWLYFEHSEGKRALFDSQHYRLIDKEALQIIEEIPHQIGYCPARFFWSTPISHTQKNIKLSPLSSQLSKLDMLLFFEVSNEHLNLYGRYPIVSAFASDCEYEEDETGNYCHKGFMKNSQGLNLLNVDRPKKCPVCSKNKLSGAGSLIEIDPPNPANDNADLRNPVQITSIDVSSLEYNNTDIENRKRKIYQAVTGSNGMSINDKAVNEKQVIAIFESLESALKLPQWNFEQIMTWTDETICRIRYGDSFVKASISLGTEHYLLTPSQIMQMYIDAKEANFSTSTLDILENKYFETEYRNNPDQLQRQNIISNIDPLRHKSSEEVTEMYEKGAIDFESYFLKVNFSSLIMRFERENLTINRFGNALPFDTKINNIIEVLKSYAREAKPQENNLKDATSESNSQSNDESRIRERTD